jgi:hypothetical protein
MKKIEPPQRSKYAAKKPATKKTIDRIAIITMAIADGATMANAAMQAGIDYVTLNRWLKDGLAATATPEQVALVVAVNLAREKWKSARLANIQAHEQKAWVASAWLLERRFPDEFGRPEKRDEKASVTWADLLGLADGK